MPLQQLFHTLRYLRPRQVAYQLFYRLTGRLAENGARTRVPGKWVGRGSVPPVDAAEMLVANPAPTLVKDTTFTFLNRSVSFPAPDRIDWNYAAEGKLWTYNLNYFEFLRQADLPATTGEALIASWIAKAPTHADAWEPYPTSLRLVNWLQFYRLREQPVPAAVHASIQRQYLSLWRKREFHLGGNHLLENAIALVLTASYLGDHRGQRGAEKLLRAELHEQYLPDGAHYERSFMYHLILLWRLLDLYGWLRAGAGATDTLDTLRQSLRRQLDYANYLITPDGRYPHFNDSTDGIAPDWDSVLNYAAALDLVPGENVITPELLQRGAGYYHWSSAELDLWIDAGDVGPTYIPGHAHADSLTFTLHLRQRPFFVDPAVSTYEKNERRAHERSTPAHNTVSLPGQPNSSDVWGGFRVGKRARTTVHELEGHYLHASHDGFADSVHHRYFSLDPDASVVTIRDELRGRQPDGTAHYYLAPGIKPRILGDKIEADEVELEFAGATSITLLDYRAAGGWNVLNDACGLRVSFTGELTLRIVPSSGKK